MDNIEVIDKVYIQNLIDSNIQTSEFAMKVWLYFSNQQKISWYLLELQGKNKEKIARITQKILSDNN
jgi:hypothetical protein